MKEQEDRPDARLRRAALDLVARREYGVVELKQRLLRKGHGAPLVDEVVGKLAAEGLVSDRRFVEALIDARRSRGMGPLRVVRELREKGVPDELIDAAVDLASRSWVQIAEGARSKRFGDARPRAAQDVARQMRFLRSRGFTLEQIRRALGAPRNDIDDDNDA